MKNCADSLIIKQSSSHPEITSKRTQANVVAKSCPTLCDPHGWQHARLPCPSLSPRVCSSSCPLSQLCYIPILSSATLFSFCLPSFPASGSDAHKIISVDMVFHKPQFSSVAQSCLALCNPKDWGPPGSSVHGDSPEKDTGVGCHALLQGIFLTQGYNPGPPHCRQNHF